MRLGLDLLDKTKVVSRCDPHGRFTIVLTIQGEPRTRARRVIQRMTRQRGTKGNEYVKKLFRDKYKGGLNRIKQD